MVWRTVGIAAAVIALVAGLGWLERHPDALKAQRQRVSAWIIGVPDPSEYECDGAGWTIAPRAEQIMAYLKVTLGETISLTWTGKVKLCNLQQYIGSFMSAQVEAASVACGAGGITLENTRHINIPVGVQNLVPGGASDWTTWKLSTAGPDTGPPDYGWLVAWTGTEEDPEEFELAFTVTISDLELQVERTAPYTPSGVGVRGSRKPEDYALSYQWINTANTIVSIAVTGPLYDDDGNPKSVYWSGPLTADAIGQPATINSRVYGALHDGIEDTEYLKITSFCDSYDVLYDGLDIDFYDGRANLRGEGNVATWKMLVSYDPGPGAGGEQDAVVSAWYAIDLSRLGVYTAERGKLAELREDCVVDLIGHSARLDYWRQFGEDNPLVIQHTSWRGWFDNSGLEGECTGPTISPQINADWAEAHGHSADDLRIHIDAGGLDWACQGSPYRELLTVEHENELEVFNPLERTPIPTTLLAGPGIEGEWAEAHPGWGEYGAGWLLSVAENAPDLTIEFALRSNMADRIEQAKRGPEYEVPEGYGQGWYPPPIPECHRIRRAGGWLPELEPPEAVTDWDNFAWLRLTLACSGEWEPEDGGLAIGYLLPVVHDNFLSGDARRTGGEHGQPYDVEWGEMAWLEYEIRPAQDDEDGYRYICLLQPLGAERGAGDGRAWPDLRWVRRLRLELPEATRGQQVFVGAHLTGAVDPKWRSDTDPKPPSMAVHATIPEITDTDSTAGPDFGMSIVTDGKPGARTVCLWRPRLEEGVPYYYYVQGAESGYDLGTVATWRQVAAELGKQQGFGVVCQEQTYLAMTHELGDPEGPQLWEPTAADWQEGSAATGRLRYGQEGEIAITFAQRVRTVDPPGLWRYDVHALKHLAGGTWGVGLAPDGPVSDAGRLRQRTYEREDSEGEWALLGRAYASEASPLMLWPMVRGALWETGIGSGDDIVGLGVLPIREFWWVAYLAAARQRGRIGMYTDQYGVCWVAWTDGEKIYISRLVAQADRTGTSEWSEREEIATVDGALAVGVTGDGHVIRVTVATEDQVLELHTLDRGRTWSEPVTIA